MSEAPKTSFSSLYLSGYCKSCQAQSSLSIALDSIACERCGEPLSVKPEVTAEMKRLRARLMDTSVSDNQLLAQSKGGYGPKLNAMASAIPWILAGFWPLLFPVFQHDDILKVIPGMNLSEPLDKLIWWTIYLPITGFTLNYFLDRLSDHISAGVAHLAGPLRKPINSPRCRICHASLPNGGVVRRCTECMSDNLMQVPTKENVTPAATSQLSLETLPPIRSQELLADSIAISASRLPWVYLLLSPLPLIVAHSFPTLSLPVHPICWLLPGLFLFSGVYFGVSSKEAEAIQSGGLVIPATGDGFYLEDGQWAVRYSITVQKPLVGGWGKKGSQIILLISKFDRKEPTHAILVNWVSKTTIETIRYKLNTVAKIHQETTEEWDHSVIVHVFSEPIGNRRKETRIAKLNWHVEGIRVMSSGASDTDISVPEQLWLSIADPIGALGRELTLEQPETLHGGIQKRAKR